MNKVRKDEVEVGMLLSSASGRYSQVLVLAGPTSRGMVACRVWTHTGDVRDVSLPWQTLRW